ncbi:Proton-dependent oligopeptide transporter family protein [Dioscorea alata]|uniref:Proton-dependent oligopeptide transporter family protein n=1 Tax=Dioscorea alata TaxID=55571 RepID=A0ACB7VF59_DIOAL|nr:Proton-dependent oligopeptide transporter family protein [Dioscorea alata]
MGEPLTEDRAQSRGGWKTSPFILGAMVGVAIAVNGVLSNLAVYLIQQYNMGSIQATQIFNIINGFISLAPILGGIISDSWLGCYSVITIASAACLLGTILATLTAALPSLRPAPCSLPTCEVATAGQLSVLYIAMGLMAVGIGGTRYSTSTMGANQFDSNKDQGIFFNWFFIAAYLASIIGHTGIVYIQDNAGWVWGFGLCSVITGIGLWLFLHGTLYFRRTKPEENPFMGLMRVIVSAVKSPKTRQISECHYHTLDTEVGKPTPPRALTDSFSFLNCAAFNTEGRYACTVDQVEDLKTLIRLVPLVSTFLLLSTSISIQNSLTTLQALVMDRHIGPGFLIPAGSVTVFVLITAILAITVLDRAIYPVCRRFAQQVPTPLQRIGIGHLLNALAMAWSALVESSRLKTLKSHQQGGAKTMSVLWIVPPLILIGVGEAFHFPGQVAMFYQEFPPSLGGTATSMAALTAGLGYYLSTTIIAMVRRLTGWLEDDTNKSRLDNVYWMLAVMAMLNFGYFLLCAKLYKRQR